VARLGAVTQRALSLNQTSLQIITVSGADLRLLCERVRGVQNEKRKTGKADVSK
jgi:hypothetical protein